VFPGAFGKRTEKIARSVLDGIIVGLCLDPNSGHYTHGGKRLAGRWMLTFQNVKPSEKVQPCDTVLESFKHASLVEHIRLPAGDTAFHLNWGN